MKFSEIELIDYDDGLKRFAGSETLYKKFLLKYTEDQTFNAVESAYLSNDRERLSDEVHTLKGTSGNLSLVNLYNECCEFFDALRAESEERINEHFHNVAKEQEKIVSAILSVTE